MNIASGHFSRLIPPFISTRWHSMLTWLGVEQFVQREWTARLPAVMVAGTLLAIYAWAAGIHQEDLYPVPVLALIGAVLSLLREVRRSPGR